jgi:hypothetical protein
VQPASRLCQKAAWVEVMAQASQLSSCSQQALLGTLHGFTLFCHTVRLETAKHPGLPIHLRLHLETGSLCCFLGLVTLASHHLGPICRVAQLQTQVPRSQGVNGEVKWDLDHPRQLWAGVWLTSPSPGVDQSGPKGSRAGLRATLP